MPTFLIAFVLALVTSVAVADEPGKPVPKFKLGKDTTFVDGPLDKDGYIDYEAALNERLKGKITPETNAVVLLMKCLGPKPEGTELHADFFKLLGIEAPPEKGDYLVGGNYFREGPDKLMPEGHSDLEDRLRLKPWTPADAPKHAAWLKLNEKPLAMAVEASKRKDYFHPVLARKRDGSKNQLNEFSMATVQMCREIASALSMRAMAKLGDGKLEDAFADLLAIHRLGRLVSRGASLLDFLVGIALQANAHRGELAIFEHGRPTVEQSLAYQRELSKLAPLGNIADKMDLYERFQFLDAIQTLHRNGFDDFPGKENLAGRTPEEIAKALDIESMLRLGNSWFDKFAMALRKPTRRERFEAKKLGDEIETYFTRNRGTDIEKLLKGDPAKLRAAVSERVGFAYVGIFTMSFEKIPDSADRAEQIHRNGLLAAGLVAHFADHKNYPDKLADLAPKYIAEVPDDVFAEKPLLYKRTDAGYLLYSVGVNGKDDGGKLISEEPRGDDIGVRLPRK